jgi:hypothetical protein
MQVASLQRREHVAQTEGLRGAMLFTTTNFILGPDISDPYLAARSRAPLPSLASSGC